MLDRARQVRSDHPWPPGSTLMATPRRNRSLERFYFAYLTRSRTEQHDVYCRRNTGLGGKGLRGAIVYNCVVLVLMGRYPDCRSLDEVD